MQNQTRILSKNKWPNTDKDDSFFANGMLVYDLDRPTHTKIQSHFVYVYSFFSTQKNPKNV